LILQVKKTARGKMIFIGLPKKLLASYSFDASNRRLRGNQFDFSAQTASGASFHLIEKLI
jgi:hypothetical protein